MPEVNYVPTALEDPLTLERRSRARAQSVGEMIAAKAGDTQTPVYSKGLGIAKLAAGAFGGLVEGIEQRREAQKQEAIARAMLALGQTAPAAAAGVGPSAPVQAAPGKLPSFAGGSAAMSMPATPNDRDLAIRTVIAEAGSQGDVGQAAVAGVLKNRARLAGTTVGQEALKPNQFEPWNPGSGNDPRRFKEDSPEYQRAAAIVDGVMDGSTPDPTGGATHFYAPGLQSQLGRRAPKWDNGSGVDIGQHRFFTLPYGNGGKTRTAEADMPAADAKPAGYDPMGNSDGYFVPPGPQAAPQAPQAPPAGSIAPSGDLFSPAPMGPAGGFTPSDQGIDPAAATAAASAFQPPPAENDPGPAPAPAPAMNPDVAALFSPVPFAQQGSPAFQAAPGGPPAPDGGQGPLTMRVAPGAPQGMPQDAPLPPSRPPEFAGPPGAPQFAEGQAPLPPPRPPGLVPADMPAPGARPARLDVGPPPAPAPSRGQQIAGMIDLNSRDGAAQQFIQDEGRAPQVARLVAGDAGGLPRQGGFAVPPAPAGGQVAPRSQDAAGAPPPGAGGPVGPEAAGGQLAPRSAGAPMPLQGAPSAPSGSSFFDGLRQAFGGAPAPTGPMSRQEALATIVRHGDPATVRWALDREQPKYGFQTVNGQVLRTNERDGSVAPAFGQAEAKAHDAGDAIVMTDGQGNEIRRIAKVKGADFGVVGKDAYGNEVFGYRNYQDQSVKVPQVAGGASGQAPVDAQGNPIPAGIDPKEVRKVQSESYAKDSVAVDPKVTAELRKEVVGTTAYKNYSQAVPVYRSMLDAAPRGTKASDLNLVYGLAKLMDPGSVVREGEMVMVTNTQALPEKLVGMINQVNGNASLSPEARSRLMTEAYGRMKAYEDEFGFATQHYSDIAKRNRMDPRDVVPTFDPVKPFEAPAPKGAPSPDAARDELRRRGVKVD